MHTRQSKNSQEPVRELRVDANEFSVPSWKNVLNQEHNIVIYIEFATEKPLRQPWSY